MITDQSFQAGARWARITALVVYTLAPPACRGHDENLHKEITKSAFQSSQGLALFLTDSLGPENAPFINSPHIFAYPPPLESTGGGGMTPRDWAAEGSYWEDMLDGWPTLRSSDHFYTVSPQRVRGQVPGLTDGTESQGVLSSPIVNSFTWATTKGMAAPVVAAA